MPLIDATAAIPVAFVLGLAAILLARGARERVAPHHRPRRRRAARAPGKALGLLGIALACAGAIAVGFYGCSARSATTGRRDAPTIGRRVRDRHQPPRGARCARASTSLEAEQATKIRAEVPPRARGRALRAAAGADVRQGLPAHVRRLPRPRRAALRRRVQLALRRRRGRAPPRPATPRPPVAGAPARRVERRCWSRSPGSRSSPRS